ncbi:molybdenum cofactor biosynthesis protein MoaE [Acinetobacter bereziniae]|uniref:molybdenum cofactor biosynthesis protein MoaE n=1 Tax=Acinetobacter bereziniae TaxID=106648 RepID=UPI00073F028B|nr:molybdenum cofactor biosynthesis protein MoaE [Acinetobacter bereziniae]
MNTFKHSLKQFNRIQDSALSLESFDPIQNFPECGGIGFFIGTVRNHHEGKAVKSLKYTSYAPVSEKMIRQIEQEIQQQFAVPYVRVIHRIGTLDIGEKAIIAVAYAAHRREAFAACEEAVERVKHEVPVWKEEFYQDGSSQYVAGCCIRKDYVGSSQVSHNESHMQQHCEHQHHSGESGQHNPDFQQHDHQQHNPLKHEQHQHSAHKSLQSDPEQNAVLNKTCEQTIYQWHM